MCTHFSNWVYSMTTRTGATKRSIESSAQVPELGRTAMGFYCSLGLISSSLSNRRVTLPGVNMQVDVSMHLDPIIRQGPLLIGSPSLSQGTSMHSPYMAGIGWVSPAVPQRDPSSGYCRLPHHFFVISGSQERQWDFGST